MQNVKMEVKKNILTVTVDLTKTFGKSASGKTVSIATTSGNIAIPDTDTGAVIGLNVYTKKGIESD